MPAQNTNWLARAPSSADADRRLVPPSAPIMTTVPPAAGAWDVAAQTDLQRNASRYGESSISGGGVHSLLDHLNGLDLGSAGTQRIYGDALRRLGITDADMVESRNPDEPGTVTRVLSPEARARLQGFQGGLRQTGTSNAAFDVYDANGRLLGETPYAMDNTFLDRVLDFEVLNTERIFRGLGDNPEQALLGGIDPIGSRIAGAITGQDYEPLVNQWGGATDETYRAAQERGIDTGPGRTMHGIAQAIAAAYAMNYGANALGGAMSGPPAQTGSVGGAGGNTIGAGVGSSSSLAPGIEAGLIDPAIGEAVGAASAAGYAPSGAAGIGGMGGAVEAAGGAGGLAAAAGGGGGGGAAAISSADLASMYGSAGYGPGMTGLQTTVYDGAINAGLGGTVANGASNATGAYQGISNFLGGSGSTSGVGGGSNWLNIGSNLLSGYMQGRAADRASDAQVAAAREANALQAYMYNTTREDFRPWREAGTWGLGQQRNLLEDPSSITRDPSYQFELDEGRRYNENSAASRGGLFSGAQIRAGQRYGQNFAGTRLNEAYNRYAGLSGTGQQATRDVAGAGQNYVNNASNNMLAAGNARASGHVGQSNAWTSSISNMLQNYQQQQLLNRLFPGG